MFRAQTSERVLVMSSGAKRVDVARLSALVGEPIGKADADFVRSRTGFVIGGVAPVGHRRAREVRRPLARRVRRHLGRGRPSAHGVSPDLCQLLAITGGAAVDVAELVLNSHVMRRTWLFVPGADPAAHEAAAASGADVIILELEDFTPPPLRPRARSSRARCSTAGAKPAPPRRCASIRWRAEARDLMGVLADVPIILMSKVERPEQVVALERATGAAVDLVPNVESAGLMSTFLSPRRARA